MTVIHDEPLTYHRDAVGFSYFRDLLFADRTPGARDRLERHAKEMEIIGRERDRRAWHEIRKGDFEYRVEPNRTQGEGGYFAPPAWLNQYFATAKRPSRVLAGLMHSVPLPRGVSSINLPIIQTGSTVDTVADTAAVPDTDITDAAGSSTVVTLTGEVDVAMQLLEQSPAGAHLDVSFGIDLAESLDAQLESQLLTGAGSALDQLTGVTNVSGITNLTYTSGSPTGSAMWPYFGQAIGQLADARRQPPECWLMRAARWGWLGAQEDTSNRPFSLSPFFLGSDEATPDPVAGLLGYPIFTNESLPATLGTGDDQDEIILLRPSDLILLEGQPQLVVFREVLSGSLGARIRLHQYVAAITNRYPTGIAVLGGTGMAVASGY